ncbi:MAG: EF-hand domain-containing protein [Gammaproteobacteria bacterium]|nr:EF-hand domain-containing protein [Gammaproteobacteria bacterium]
MAHRRRQIGGREAACVVASFLVGCTTLVGEDGLNDVDRAFITAAISWDLNKDGQVTCDEWKSYARELFTAADTDRDGRLTRAEFERVSRDDKTFVIANFRYFDRDGDGFVSYAEFVERQNPAFKLLDRNNDCVLDSAELGPARTLNRPAPSGPPASQDKGGGGMPGGKSGM